MMPIGNEGNYAPDTNDMQCMSTSPYRPQYEEKIDGEEDRYDVDQPFSSTQAMLQQKHPSGLTICRSEEPRDVPPVQESLAMETHPLAPFNGTSVQRYHPHIPFATSSSDGSYLSGRTPSYSYSSNHMIMNQNSMNQYQYRRQSGRTLSRFTPKVAVVEEGADEDAQTVKTNVDFRRIKSPFFHGLVDNPCVNPCVNPCAHPFEVDTYQLVKGTPFGRKVHELFAKAFVCHEPTNDGADDNFRDDLYDDKDRLYYRQSDMHGNIYEGEFYMGKRDGHGTIFYADTQDMFIGEWVRDEPHGYGTLVRGDGFGEFEGRWEHGQLIEVKEGFAHVMDSDGTVYAGTFLNWTKDGSGTLLTSDGYKYTGDWMNGVKHGYGVFEYPDGSRFEGLFDNDEPTEIITDSRNPYVSLPKVEIAEERSQYKAALGPLTEVLKEEETNEFSAEFNADSRNPHVSLSKESVSEERSQHEDDQAPPRESETHASEAQMQLGGKMNMTGGQVIGIEAQEDVTQTQATSPASYTKRMQKKYDKTSPSFQGSLVEQKRPNEFEFEGSIPYEKPLRIGADDSKRSHTAEKRRSSPHRRRKTSEERKAKQLEARHSFERKKKKKVSEDRAKHPDKQRFYEEKKVRQGKRSEEKHKSSYTRTKGYSSSRKSREVEDDSQESSAKTKQSKSSSKKSRKFKSIATMHKSHDQQSLKSLKSE